MFVCILSCTRRQGGWDMERVIYRQCLEQQATEHPLILGDIAKHKNAKHQKHQNFNQTSLCGE